MLKIVALFALLVFHAGVPSYADQDEPCRTGWKKYVLGDCEPGYYCQCGPPSPYCACTRWSNRRRGPGRPGRRMEHCGTDDDCSPPYTCFRGQCIGLRRLTP